MLWNVTYKISDEDKFVEAMNKIRPNSYNIRYKPKWYMDTLKSEMIELDEEEAFMLSLSTCLTLEKLD